ncbi:hypothetical protein VPH35_136840 [Triticum aestivum]
MLSTSGFGWDWIHNKLMVDSEDVWSNYVKANKDAACYRHNVTKFWDSISLVFSKDHATGIGARTAAESVAEMAAENVNNVNIESAKKKRYRSDDSIASILGEKLDNFTSAYKADIAQVVPRDKPSSPKEILDALNAIAGLDDDDLLAAYDILIADDRKFKALMALPERMKNKWILKQISQ